jgi:hypothetical protein
MALYLTVLVIEACEIVPPEITGFAYAKTMPVDQHADQPVPLTMSVPLEGIEQGADLLLC